MSLEGNVKPEDDRLNSDSRGSFRTLANSYARPPAGNYVGGMDFTLTMWVKINAIKGQKCLFDFGDGNEVDNFYFVTRSSDSPHLPFVGVVNGADNEGNVYYFGSVLTTDVWLHLAFRF
jgi:hypothetical protein